MVRVAERSLCKRMIRGELRKNDSFLMCVFFFFLLFVFTSVQSATMNKVFMQCLFACMCVCGWMRMQEREKERGRMDVCMFVRACVNVSVTVGFF